MESESEHNTETLFQDLQSAEAHKRKAAAEELRTFSWGDERIFLTLEKLASTDNNHYVASAAFQTLELPLIHQEFIKTIGRDIQQEAVSRYATPPQSNKIERPLSITIICILGFITTIPLVILLPIFVFAKVFVVAFLWYLLFVSLGGLVCTIGLWQMKKWAFYAFALLFLIMQVYHVYLGNWSIESLLSLPAIAAYSGYRNLSKMT